MNFDFQAELERAQDLAQAILGGIERELTNDLSTRDKVSLVDKEEHMGDSRASLHLLQSIDQKLTSLQNGLTYELRELRVAILALGVQQQGPQPKPRGSKR